MVVPHPLHILGGGGEAADCTLVGARGIEALLDFRWERADCRRRGLLLTRAGARTIPSALLLTCACCVPSLPAGPRAAWPT